MTPLRSRPVPGVTISTRSTGGAMSWHRVEPTIAPDARARTAHGSRCPAVITMSSE